MGVNYRYSSNIDTKLYSYHVTPQYNGYYINGTYRIHIDARSNQIKTLRLIKGEGLRFTLPIHDGQIPISIEKGKEKLNALHPGESVTHFKTLYIPSVLSNQYELVHQYKTENGKEHYINTMTGEIDASY